MIEHPIGQVPFERESAHIASDYGGSHWLGTFAMLALDDISGRSTEFIDSVSPIGVTLAAPSR
jgi:hypothetical protein